MRNPGAPFRTTTILTQYVRGKAGDQTVLTVWSKEDKTTGQFRNLVRYVQPPRDAGKMALLDGQNLWFYDPAAKSSVRISTQQRLVGQAAIGDVLTINFAVDYTGILLGDAGHPPRRSIICPKGYCRGANPGQPRREHFHP